MSYCADTNILLRLAEPGTEASAVAQAAVKELRARGETIFVTPQNLVEFWTVATRPRDVNGLGLTIKEADDELTQIEALFPLLPDTADIHGEWRNLVVDKAVIGVRTHDARIAASLRVNGVAHILTFNVDDFKSFDNPIPVNPRHIVSKSA